MCRHSTRWNRPTIGASPILVPPLRSTWKIWKAATGSSPQRSLRRREITGLTLPTVLARYPLMTAQVIGAIHWQALRLRLKGAPVHPHPDKLAHPATIEG
jgi:Protein of unknown function (DUF1365)